jgi:UDP-2,3-diacylglucosamine hydrolase
VAGEGLGILAGRGMLPRLIAEDCARRGRPYRVVVFEGVPLDWVERHPVLRAAFEKPGRLFADLRAAGCGTVTFAGSLTRPTLNPLRFDLTMLRLAPKVFEGLRSGDDRALRLAADVFEAEGLTLQAPQAILGDLVMPAGVPTRAKPGPADRADAERAVRIVAALGVADVGQGAVVAQGLCLGLETIQGTDAMLAFVARTAGGFRPDPRARAACSTRRRSPGRTGAWTCRRSDPRRCAAPRRPGLAGVVVQAGRRVAARARGDDRRRRRFGAVSLGPRGRDVSAATGPRLFLVAGEPSGDRLGAALLEGLHRLCGEGLPCSRSCPSSRPTCRLPA